MKAPNNWQRITVLAILSAIVLVIMALPSFPSVDGAAHLYNSIILNDLLIDSNSSLAQTHQFNHQPIPNYLDHVLQAFFMLFVSPLLAQKLMVVLTIILGSVIFLNIAKHKKNQFLWLAFVPLLFSYFLYAGMNNQLMSFIVFLAFIGYLDKKNFNPDNSTKALGILFVFSVLLWSTNILGFCIAIGIYGLCLIMNHKENFWPKALGSFIILSPTILLTVLFVTRVEMHSAEPNYTVYERFWRLVDLNVLRTFGMGGEPYILPVIGTLFIVLLGVSLYKMFLSGDQPIVRYILSCLFLFVVVVPNDIGAGMVTNRLVIYFWLFAFVIIKKQIQFKPGSIVVSLVIFLGFFIIQNKAYNTHIKKYAQVGYEFYEIGAFIPSGKTVWSINFSEEWFVGHSSNYASIPNKSIAIENYEANNAWFPIVWDDHFQKEGNLYATYYHLDSIESFVAIPSDYLLIYGEPNEDFQNSLAMSATLIHEKNEIQLYQLKK